MNRTPSSNNRLKSKRNSSDHVESALYYVLIGWAVFPVHSIKGKDCACGKTGCNSPGKHPLTKNGFKDATKDVNKIKSWWKKWPNANIGIATGKESGIVVLDIDFPEGEASLEKLVGSNELPETIESITGGGGKHIFFSYPRDRVIKNAVGFKGNKGIDIRADGGYIVAPPSLHISGKKYKFSSSPKEIELAPVPDWLCNLLASGENQGTASIRKVKPVGSVTRGKVLIGARNATLTKRAGFLRRFGLDEDALNSVLQSFNKSECEPPLEDSEVLQIAKSIAKYPPSPESGQPNLTDLGNSEIMADLFSQDYKFCASWKKWFVWDGMRWIPDEKKMVYQAAKATVRQMYTMGIAIPNEDLRSRFMSHTAKSESLFRIKAMVELTSSHPDIAITPCELDKDSWLFNVENGTIDLRTGALKSHDRKDLITRIVPVRFDVEAKYPRFEKFLDEIFGDKATIDFIQKAVGCCLAGIQKDHKLFLLYGTGANGKSTFLNTMLKLVGDYGLQTPTETLLKKRGGGIPNDIARLKGARFVSAVEAQEGERFNETLIKQLTGGDPITARFLHAEFFTFQPEFKIWIGTNHKPTIRETTTAIWRRICVIPFENEFQSELQDKDLPEKLENELPGILNWALEGCLKWQAEGLPDSLPEKIDDATTAYRKEMDFLANFLLDCCEMDSGARIQSSFFYEAYSVWCEENEEKALSLRQLAFRMEERGFKKDSTRQGRFWRGIKLKRRDA